MQAPSRKIAIRHFLQTVALCTVLAVLFGLLYFYVQKETDSQVIRLGFGFLSVLTMGVCLTIHAHFVLIRPLHTLSRGLRNLDSQALMSEDFVILKTSGLICEFEEIENEFHSLIQKLHARHREVMLAKNNLVHLSARFHENKLSALGEMAAGIAHEINNPLAILLGRLEQLRELTRPVSNAKIDTVVLSMEKTFFRIQEAVADLELIASNPSAEELRAVNISRLITRLSKVVRNRFVTEEILFECLVQNDLELQGREVELSQAFLYLLENAAEAAQKSEDRWVRIELRVENEEGCRILLSDSGSGVPKNLRHKLFEPFFSTKDEGRGMGLSLSKSIVIGHGGELIFDFDAPHTTICIELPFKQSKVSAA
ncbi:MAG: GHKL domain-containing protein [Proteobacteria bacterium]|nr:MAG: GHKL domain-containing protein [Pseudomonadota bacterium]